MTLREALWNKNSILVNMHFDRICAERSYKETVFTKILPLASHNGAVFYNVPFYVPLLSLPKRCHNVTLFMERSIKRSFLTNCD